ncbi:hypothetical protein NLJ89_g3780 [Agrocybe chaxingu]|uniref:NADH:flavin oxidoreductase/NADH oxidase N-terminal domain-containing protein n=1 Tax=Agrocybe chaxingu TaxID=84603 RepID=A0A9W8K9I3_9AGAR|nr:hypothetical protein NLJ89_g3780 [Agrocybe chaxingu]
MAGNALLQPLQVGTIVLKNRIAMSAMTRNRAPRGYPSNLMKEYYIQRSSAGLIVTEGLLITRQGTDYPNAPGIWDEKHIAGWKDIVDAVHEAGSKIYAQLWHLGRLSHPEAPEQKLAGVPVYGPSAIAARGGKFRGLPGTPGFVKPSAIEDPWTIIAQYKQAAVNAQKAGFDGVELHAANGYLVMQFLDNTSNQRTDKWGGSVENRCRFGLEVLNALIEVFGQDVGIKLSPAGGYNDVGMSLQDTLDTYSYFITEADKLNPGYIALVRYSLMTNERFDGVLRATGHDVFESYPHLIKNARVFLNSGISPEEGHQFVSEGKADGVFFGFSWLTHPDLVGRIKRGHPLDNALDFLRLIPEDGEQDWSKGYVDYPMYVQS